MKSYIMIIEDLLICFSQNENPSPKLLGLPIGSCTKPLPMLTKVGKGS